MPLPRQMFANIDTAKKGPTAAQTGLIHQSAASERRGGQEFGRRLRRWERIGRCLGLYFHDASRHATTESPSRRMSTMPNPSKRSGSSIGDMFGAATTSTFLGLPEATVENGARAAIAILGAPAATPYPSVGAYCAGGPCGDPRRHRQLGGGARPHGFRPRRAHASRGRRGGRLRRPAL
jgi:hypothetical protein